MKQYMVSIREIIPLISDEALDFYLQGLTVSFLDAKHNYIEKGDLQTMAGYLFSGLIRAFYIDKNGNEINVDFIKERNYIIHYGAFARQERSKYYFQCLEPSIMINIPLDHIRICCERFPSFEHYLRLRIEHELYRKQTRIDSFIFNNAEERYLDFIHNNPELFKRISISHLSSYLGIERQTLTRIRKKLLQTGL